MTKAKARKPRVKRDKDGNTAEEIAEAMESLPQTVEEAAKVVAASKGGKERISMWRRIGEAYRDGYAVGRKGRDNGSNPFSDTQESVEFWAWQGGHEDGAHAFATKPVREPKAAQEEAVAS